jgi:tetratricopeptide (TPR) repeat protein
MANAERALTLAKRIDDPAGQAKAYWLRMLVQTRIDAKGAVDSGTASLELARRHRLREQEAFTLNDIQSNYQVLGEPDRALQALEEARPIWREIDNVPMLADNLASTAMLHALVADYPPAFERAHEALAISDQIGNLWGQSYGRIAIGLAHFAKGELGAAIREMTTCVDLAERAGFIYPQVAIRSILAIAYGLAGDLERATRLAALVRQVEERSPFPGQISGMATQAWIAVQQGDLDRAKTLLEEVERRIIRIDEALTDSPVPLAMAEEAFYLAGQDLAGALEKIDTHAHAFGRFAWKIILPFLLLARGRALVGLGRTTEARETFLTVLADMRAQGFDLGLWEVEAELGQLALAQGELAEAAPLLTSSARRIRDLAADLEGLGLAQGFLARPQIRAILGQAGPFSP